MWHIINKEKISNFDFYEAIKDELLGCNIISHVDLRNLSNGLESIYEEVLSYFYDAMEKNFYQDIIEAIKATKNLLYKNMNWVLNEINKLKNYE